MKLDPKEVKQIRLGLGFRMSEGVVLAALANSLKYKRCSLQNEINLENVRPFLRYLFFLNIFFSETTNRTLKCSCHGPLQNFLKEFDSFKNSGCRGNKK